MGAERPDRGCWNLAKTHLSSLVQPSPYYTHHYPRRYSSPVIRSDLSFPKQLKQAPVSDHLLLCPQIPESTQ